MNLRMACISLRIRKEDFAPLFPTTCTLMSLLCSMILLLADMQVFKRPSPEWLSMFIFRVWLLMWNSLCVLALHVKCTKLATRSSLGCYSLFQWNINLGKTLVWILLCNYLSLVITMLFLLSWTDSVRWQNVYQPLLQ